MGLTADLVRARVRGPTIRPVRPDASDEFTRELAERICDTFTAAAESGARFGEVIAELEDAVEEGGQAKLTRGLIRIAQDRVRFVDLGEDLDPAALRMEVFLRAAAGGEPARRVLEEVAAARETTPERIAETLYADLPAERRVERFDVPDAGWLLRRYDVALVQALLVGAYQVRIVLAKPTAPRMRQLVRWIKFNQLLHTAERGEDGELVIVLDGPVSMFGPSTRYGIHLARLFPSLLLQDGPWRMEATVAWTKARHKKELVITRDDGYVTHHADTGAYRTKVQTHFAERFAEKDRSWTLSEGSLPITVGPRDLLFPDYTLTRADGREVHLEIVGYWRPERLEQRLEALDRYGPPNLILAVSRKLLGAKAGDLPEHRRVVPFADVLSVPKVLEAAEACVS